MTPFDRAHRERIRTALHETLFVEAGAGTGKTRELIERLVALVNSGVPIESIAAITFTEAAAAELRDRLRARLEQEQLANPGTAAFEDALEALDGAAIQTLHAFAQRLLASYPVEAGLPPRFEVLDEVLTAIVFDEAWEAFLVEFLGENGPALLIETLTGLGFKLTSLREIARLLHDNYDRVPLPPPSLGDLELPRLDDVTHLCEQILGFEQMTLGSSTLTRDGYPHVKEILSYAALPGAIGVVSALGFKLTTRKDIGNRDALPGHQLETIRALFEDLRATKGELHQVFIDDTCACLRDWLAHFVHDFAAARRRQGKLVFHDLLVLARDLLASNVTVREAVNRRYRHLFIDEFQDTDPLQVEIASLVARTSTHEAGWQQSTHPEGSLFFVGDPKQSIYRFRRADIALYMNSRDLLGQARPLLQQNFRSTPGVVDWVNAVFGRLIAEDHPRQPRYEELLPARPARVDAPGVAYFGGPAPAGENAAGSHEREALDIAAAIQRIRHEQWLIGDGDESRVARLADIAILVPQRTNVGAISDALEAAGIPYRLESRSLLYNTAEIADLINILAAVADPTDEVAIVAALRSPSFACTDLDLYEYRKAAGPAWSYHRPVSTGLRDGHPVVAGLARLREWHGAAGDHAINALVERVIREGALMELAFAFPRPRERWQRYRFLLEQSRYFASLPGATLRRFVRWLRDQQESRVRVVESGAPPTDDDAVRITTIHASKGLEYPIVLLASLGAAFLKRTDAVVWDGESNIQLRLATGYKGAVTAASSGYIHARDAESDALKAERMRLLYVGATRARDHLVVSLHHKDGTDCYAKQLCDFLDEPGIPWRPLDTAPAELEAPPPPAPSQARLALGVEDLAAWQARRSAAIAAVARGNAVGATAVAHSRHPLSLDEGDPEVEDQPWRRGRAGTNIGRAVHAVLQVANLTTGEGIDEAAGAQAIAEGVPGEARQVASLARAALSSGAVREALAGRHWREVFVSASIGGALLEGFVDLLYERDGALVVADYKTDAVRSDADIAQRVAHYRLQLACYALALEANLGQDVAECRLVFLRGNDPIDRVIPDLDGAKAEARAILEAWPETAAAAM